jgi:hypothetical protein
MKPSQKSLKDWTVQEWRTKSGKPSSKTGERKAKGKQFVPQPSKIAKKTARFR